MIRNITQNLSSSAARARTQARASVRTSHQARNLAKLSSDIYVHQGERVYLLDTYSHKGHRIAMVMEVDEQGIYEVFYDQLEML